MDIFHVTANIIDKYDNIVFFGGAGVSTECGIPDFRSSSGIYNQSYRYNPEEILSQSFFNRSPEIFYDFLWNHLFFKDAKPNKGHKALAYLEHIGKVKSVITQNIDGLHQQAGSKNVLELHGSINNFYCTGCLKKYSIDNFSNKHTVPICNCGEIIRPDVVLYEEPLNENILKQSIDYISKADVLIIAGTSLLVYPAAGLLRYFKGRKLILINKSKTSYDNHADLIIRTPFAAAMENIMLTIGLWQK